MQKRHFSQTSLLVLLFEPPKAAWEVIMLKNRRTRKITGIILALLLVAGQFLNSGTGVQAANKKIKLNSKKITLSVGQSKKLKVFNTNGKNIKWSSSKKSVASVNKNGLVKAKKAGKAVITASVSDKKLKCNVVVRKASAKPSNTQTPAQQVTPVPTQAPESTQTPEATAVPEETITPEVTAGPETTPAPTQTPDVSVPGQGKLLVAYFSWSGTSERIAQNIIAQTGADSFRIERETPYSTNYNEVAYGEAQTEAETNARPPIKDPLPSVSQYGKIVLCYPIWWHTAPMCVGTFLESYDFTGKIIYPVSQSASMSTPQYEESVAFIKECAKGATVDDGLFSKDSTAINNYINEKVLP